MGLHPGLGLAGGSSAGLDYVHYVSVFSYHSAGHLCFWGLAEYWLMRQEQLGMYLLSFRRLHRLVDKVALRSKSNQRGQAQS